MFSEIMLRESCCSFFLCVKAAFLWGERPCIRFLHHTQSQHFMSVDLSACFCQRYPHISVLVMTYDPDVGLHGNTQKVNVLKSQALLTIALQQYFTNSGAGPTWGHLGDVPGGLEGLPME